MDIHISTSSHGWTKFERVEWKLADREHYGADVTWKKTGFRLTAKEKGTIVGVARMDIQNGVAYIDTLLVGKKDRGKGIGKALLAEAEHLARKNGAHKIHLQTGKTWDSVGFYETLGYAITGELADHYFHADFVEMAKSLR